MHRFFFWVLFFPTLLFSQSQQQWVDSVYASMTLDQKIGQLFMVMAYPDGNTIKQKQTLQSIRNHHVGGVLFSKGTSAQQQKDTKRYQRLSQVPLFIAADAEWGMAMRLDDVPPYPYAMTLGALPNEDLIYALAKRMGVSKRKMGVHISFAPVADVNTEAKNPIIGVRAFGDNPTRVARQATAFMEGLQDAGILAVGKHFPGHGAAIVDSHKSLPTITHTNNQLDSIDLVPFRKLIAGGVKGIMVGHLQVPALEKDTIPVSVSTKVITNLLQKQLGFKGLVFTDALNMSGVTQPVESPALAAFLAGADVLVMPENLTKAIASIRASYVNGEIHPKRLALSVKKILTAKYALGLHKRENLISDAKALKTNYEDVYLKQQIALKSIVNVFAKPNHVPLKPESSIGYMRFGKPKNSVFFQELQKHAKTVQAFSGNAPKSIRGKSIVVGVFADTYTPWKNTFLTNKDAAILHHLAHQNKVYLVVFAKPYALQQFPNLSVFSNVLWAHENQPEIAKAATKILFGKHKAVGVFPIETAQ
jgi:beta-N-acetylhexosaminidase